ncbi:MAG: transketolase, partial [Candidatus Cloacimonetes bacterium]|nr:transketolase [Candidatus Cloacimonadota bacterium]
MKPIDRQIIIDLEKQAVKARAAILHMTTLAQSGHPGGSMSAIDFILTLYRLMHHDPANPSLPERDRLVVSNGHISPAVYSALALNGYFDLDDAIAGYRKLGSIFPGHVERITPGVEWSSGNLGQGLSAACGIALAARINQLNYRVWTIMGDGEQQKGQISEARRFAIKYHLHNLAVIIDYNHLQIGGDIKAIMPQNIRRNWEADGWNVLEIQGHDLAQVYSSIRDVKTTNKPTMILAHTNMGRGVPFMENQARYHGSPLSEAQLDDALKILGMTNRLDEYRRLRNKNGKTHAHHDLNLWKPALTPGRYIIYDCDTDNRSAWGNALADLAMHNKDSQTPMVVLDCDLQGSVKTDRFEKAMPDRFFQCGIMEHHAAVMGGALSTCGIQTFWADFGIFGMEEVFNMQRLNDINHTNLKTVVTHVGIDVGEDGLTHQCINYIGLMRNLFGYRLICPADPNHTDRIVRWVATQSGNYLIAMGRSKLPILRNDNQELMFGLDYSYEYGKMDILREGKEATVLVTGTPVGKAVKAVDILREEGIFLRLMYVASPLEISRDDLIHAASTGLIFTI